MQYQPRFRNRIQRSLGLSEFKVSKTRAALEQQIAAAEELDYHTLKHEASAAIGGAGWANRDYENQRKSGSKKFGRQTQRFVRSFAGFVGAYGGLVEVLKSASPGYGEVFYECLSVMFIVVLNKSSNDIKISAMLDEMRKSFPQLDDWVKIYPTQAIKVSVVEVYKNVIEFSRTASIYFNRFSSKKSHVCHSRSLY